MLSVAVDMTVGLEAVLLLPLKFSKGELQLLPGMKDVAVSTQSGLGSAIKPAAGTALMFVVSIAAVAAPHPLVPV